MKLSEKPLTAVGKKTTESWEEQNYLVINQKIKFEDHQ